MDWEGAACDGGELSPDQQSRFEQVAGVIQGAYVLCVKDSYICILDESEGHISQNDEV